MKYVKRYNKFNFQTNCRVCFTQSVSKISLTAPLRGDKDPKPLVFEALQVLTKLTVPLNAKYPQSICGMCLELLKIAYDLVLQYQSTQKILSEKFEDFAQDFIEDSSVSGNKDKNHGKNGKKVNSVAAEDLGQDIIEDPSVSVNKSKKCKKGNSVAPVEIYVGEEKFDLNELLIIEDENEDNVAYDGFLSNLGTTVSATIVKRGRAKRRPSPETPSVVIEKIVHGYADTTDIIQMAVNRMNEPIEPANEIDFIEEPCNTDIFKNLTDLNKADKEIVDLAMNLKFKCPHCLKPMSSLNRVKNHVRNCDKNSLNTICHVCDTKLKSRKQLLLHIRVKHLDTFKKNPRYKKYLEGFTCRICGQSFRSSGSLNYHVRKHKGRSYSCPSCDKTFFTATQVRNHALTHSRKPVVVCPICGKTFHYKSGLHYHMKMHLNERNLQCSYCPRKFYTRNSVKRHELTHTGDRPFPCQYCEKCFRSTGEKRKHELLHTGERPFSCKYCDGGFSQAHNLKVHMLTHRGSFSCTHCFKSFADADILRFHLKHKHRITNTIGALERTEPVIAEEIQQIGEFAPSEEMQLENEDAFFVTEDFDDQEDDQNVYVQTYELKDEDLLVETLESVEGLE